MMHAIILRAPPDQTSLLTLGSLHRLLLAVRSTPGAAHPPAGTFHGGIDLPAAAGEAGRAIARGVFIRGERRPLDGLRRLCSPADPPAYAAIAVRSHRRSPRITISFTLTRIARSSVTPRPPTACPRSAA